MTNATLIVTAADSRFSRLARELVSSIRNDPEGRSFPVGFINLGLTDTQLDWFRTSIDLFCEQKTIASLPIQIHNDPRISSRLIRPFLPEIFPGYRIYIWIDADVWIQNWKGVDRYIAGAEHHGLAASVHDHPAYYNSLNLVTYRFRKFEQAYGVEFARMHVHSPYYNAGILAIASDAPHWAVWAKWLQKVIDSGNPDTLNRISDQIPLNAAIHEEALSVDTLSAIYNWQCHLCLPCWDECSGKLCEPVNHSEISMIHLTGKYKTEQEYRIKTTDGNIKSIGLRYNNHQG